MRNDRLVHPSLIAGHAALAMLAVAAIHVTSPLPTAPQWHVAGHSRQVFEQRPRRLPASRRTERTLVD
jgi:hypothetical protein